MNSVGISTIEPMWACFFQLEYYESEIEPLFGYQCLDCNDYDGTTPDDNIYEQQQQTKRTKQETRSYTSWRTLKITCATLIAWHSVSSVSITSVISCRPCLGTLLLNSNITCNMAMDKAVEDIPCVNFVDPHDFTICTNSTRTWHEIITSVMSVKNKDLPINIFAITNLWNDILNCITFCVRDAQCRAARFVVFENEIDLRGHELSTHGATSSGSTKIQLEFRYRRSNEQAEQQQNVPSSQDFEYGVDGQAFCPQVTTAR